MKVHQLLSGAGPVDAVTSQALLWQRLMAGWGIEGDVFADLRDPAVGAGVRSARRMDRELRADDAVLVHFSAFGRRTSAARELPNRLLFAYHNITPDRFLWDHEPLTAALCAAARRELPLFASAVHSACAVSEYNAAELREAGFSDVAVVPNILDFAALTPEQPVHAPSPSPAILFVGRISPHKRFDALIQAVALLRERHGVQARLVCVGPPLSHRFVDNLRDLAERVGVPVDFTGSVPQEELNRQYAEAAAFLCLSEHEGFCIPIVEAMHMGVPVVAARAGAVADVAGDAAVLLDGPDPSVAAEALAIVLADDEARPLLRERGRRRAAQFGIEPGSERLRAWVEHSLA